jgi:DNA-directed RNA polymerase I, II, and III subunit RPABC1
MNKEYIVNSFGIILEMLQDRGIDTGDITKKHIEDVLATDSLKPLVEVVINRIKVIYYTPPKFKAAEVRKTLEETEPYDHYILVVQENITQNNMKIINQLGLDIEVHLLNRLQFNITKHHLVPKHEVIKDKKEIEDILTRYKLKTKYQLPIILRTDAVARYYGMKNGDIVKITRKSETAGEYVMYRCCL